MGKTAILIIDGNNITCRASAVIDKDEFITGVNTGILWGMLNKRLRAMKEDGYEEVLPLVTFDVGYRPVSNDSKINRYEMDTEYKANRIDDGSDPKRTAFEAARKRWQAEWEQELLDKDTTVLKYPNTEADDLMAYSALKLADLTEATIDQALWTTDKDLMQVVSNDDGSRIIMYRRLKGKDVTVDYDEVINEKGVAPEKIRMQLALQGDAADNYSKIKGMGGKRGLQLINEVNDFNELLARLPEYKEQLEFNWKLAGCGKDYMSSGALLAADNAIDLTIGKL